MRGSRHVASLQGRMCQQMRSNDSLHLRLAVKRATAAVSNTHASMLAPPAHLGHHSVQAGCENAAACCAHALVLQHVAPAWTAMGTVLRCRGSTMLATPPSFLPISRPCAGSASEAGQAIATRASWNFAPGFHSSAALGGCSNCNPSPVGESGAYELEEAPCICPARAAGAVAVCDRPSKGHRPDGLASQELGGDAPQPLASSPVRHAPLHICLPQKRLPG